MTARPKSGKPIPTTRPGSPGAAGRPGDPSGLSATSGTADSKAAAPLSADSRTNAELRRSGLIVLGLYLFIAAYLVPIFPHGGSANELTRWATDASLVERHSFEITWSESMTGPIIDGAKVGERIYSNKPPATALLALPGYLAGRLVAGPPDPANIRITWTLMRWCVGTIPMLIFALALWRRGASPLVLCAVLFATPLFVYSLLLFSHVLVAAALFGAYRMLYASRADRADRAGPPGLPRTTGLTGPSTRDALLAGALCGIAVCSEFPSVIAVAVLGLGTMFAFRREVSARLWTCAWFVLGGAPFAAGLAIYNASIFGSPFALSYAHETFERWAEVASQGVFGIGWPSPANFWLLIGSPSRGLFFYSPILILACISLIRISGEEALRRIVRLAVVISGIILISGHGAAHGGWAAGPRYILFVLPFLIEPLIETNWFELRPGLAGLLLGASICLSVLPALCFPFVPHEFSFPHNTFWRPLLAGEGWAVPTLGALAGLGSGLPALAPVVIALGCALAISLRRAPRRMIGGLLAGVLLVGLYCFLPGLDNVDLALGRAVIAERFFRPQGRLESFRALATDPAQLRALDELRWIVADARAFAPGNWPYSTEPLPKEAPSSIQPRARALQQQGKLGEAVQLYRAAREEYPFARCKFTDQMAVALYLSGDRGKALEELESVRPLVSGNPSADCCLVLFHLGNLYSEQHRTSDARSAFQEYLQATEGDQSPVSVRSRQEAAAQALRLASQ